MDNYLFGPPITVGTSAVDLTELLKQRRHQMTRAEKFEQKVSFVYGVMDADSGITKDQVRAILAAADGTTPP
jgi:hypothetical protein